MPGLEKEDVIWRKKHFDFVLENSDECCPQSKFVVRNIEDCYKITMIADVSSL